MSAPDFGLAISNEHRGSSLSIPSVEAEMLETLGGGEDPLDILCRLEDEHGYVSYEAIEQNVLR